MHHTVVTDDETGREWHFNHNGDFSGDLWISAAHDDLEDYGDSRGVIAKIPFSVLLELVGRHLALERISTIENMSGAEFLKGL